MALRYVGKDHYGDSAVDIREEITGFSTANGYIARHFADALCLCGSKIFRLSLDDSAGVAVRTCIACADVHPIGDSAEYLSEADLQQCGCLCGKENFEITVGVSLYRDSEDVRWLYLGCRCPDCGLTGVYGEWKNEYENYRELLALV